MFRRLLSRVWWQLHTPGRVRRARLWFRPEPKLTRGKLTIACAAGLFTIISFNHQVQAQATEQHHDLQCQRAAGRDDVRDVLFAILDFVAPGGSGSDVRTIIDLKLPAIHVDNCSIGVL